MSDQDYIDKLETMLAQLIQPVKGVPFRVVVKALAGQDVIKCVPDHPDDARLLEMLNRAIQQCSLALKAATIRRSRPNEVGNDIELFVIEALNSVGLLAMRPQTRSGRKKTTGYPDILFYDEQRRPCYLECKIFSQGTRATTMRSFYLSPSDDFKVTHDARHLMLAFEMRRGLLSRDGQAVFVPVSFKLVDLFGLDCDMKHEFNADNRRLYHREMILLEGSC